MVTKAIYLGASLLGSITGINTEIGTPFTALTQKTVGAAAECMTALSASQESLTDACPFEPFADVPPPQCFPAPDVESAAAFGEKRLLTGQDQLDSANKQHTRVQNCLTSACPALAQEPGHIEKAAIEAVVFEQCSGSSITHPHPTDELRSEIRDEILRLNINDPREKLLYFRAARDGNGALDPKSSSHILNAFYNKFDMKYRVVQSYDEICEEIQEAAKIGKLTTVVIDTHGSPEGMYLSDNKGIHRYALYSSPSCFAGLEPSAKIFLFSCCTGAPRTAPDTACFRQWDFSDRLPIVHSNYQPFAQAMADHLKRQVIAAEIPVNGLRTEVISLDPFMVFHPQIRDSGTNTYKVFSPNMNPEQDNESFTSALTEALKTSIYEIQHEVLEATQKLLDREENIEAAISAAREALKSSDFQIDTPAAFELFKILVRKGSGIEAAISAVIEAFEKSTNFQTHTSAMNLLYTLLDNGYGFETASGIAIKAFNHTNSMTRVSAFSLLEKLVDKGYGFEAAINAATKALDSNSSDWYEIKLALSLLGKLVEKGESFDAAIGAAIEAFNSSNPEIRAGALRLFEKLVDKGQSFDAAIGPALKTLKNKKDGETSKAAYDLLVELFDKRQGFEATISAATEMFNSTDVFDQGRALLLFEQLVDRGQGFEAARSAATDTLQKCAHAEVLQFARTLLEKLDKQSAQETAAKKDL